MRDWKALTGLRQYDFNSREAYEESYKIKLTVRHLEAGRLHNRLALCKRPRVKCKQQKDATRKRDCHASALSIYVAFVLRCTDRGNIRPPRQTHVTSHIIARYPPCPLCDLKCKLSSYHQMFRRPPRV